MSTAAAVQAVAATGGPQTGVVMQQVEARMLELAAGHGPVLERFAVATVAAGGKRLRPLLVCLASGVPVVSNELLLRAACAVELVHAATLVHDDVIDGADLRRGEPTVVAAGGRLMALTVGDFLLSRAFAELAQAGSVEAVRVLSAAAADLAAGELMQRQDAWRADVSVERYLERCRLKTGVLFKAACELGALAGDGDAVLLGGFGERIGVAFQLLDDVLDVTGPAERTGKPRGADLLDGTVTLPLIEALARDRSLHSLDLRAVTTADDAGRVSDRIEATGALAVAREHALTVVAEAKQSLQQLPDAQRAALELVADGVVDRYS